MTSMNGKKTKVQTQTEWEIEMSERILGVVRNELYMDLRFLDVALCALRWQSREGIAGFATDGEVLYYSTEQLLRVFESNPGFLNRAYLHSVFHCLFGQLWVRGNRDRALWNLACDIVVEHTIDGLKCSSTKRALSWIRKQTYEKLQEEKQGMSAAIVYRYLLPLSQEQRMELAKEFYTDNHSFWPKEEQGQQTSQSSTAKKWDKMSRETRMELETRGDETMSGQEAFEQLLRADKSRRSYREFLQKFAVLREELHCDPDEFDLNYYTYGLENYGNMPLIEPVETREVKKIQEFVVVVDTSYSTSGDKEGLVKQFLKETFQILMDRNSFFAKCEIHIIQCDNQIQVDEKVTSQEELTALLNRFTIQGGGGTDFRPAFAYVNQLMEQGKLHNLRGLLYFTDGKGIYPKKKPPYDTAFLFLEEYEEQLIPPWAMRLRLEPEGFQPKHRG